MKNNALYFISFFILAGCISNKSRLDASYFTSSSRTGFILISKLESTSSSSGGVVGALASIPSKGKYDEALQILKPIIMPDEKVKQLYTDAFSAKGKMLSYIKDTLEFKKDILFSSKNKDSKKKYFKYDLRLLKEKYQIDELLLVTAEYGVYAKYSYGIESARYGKMHIKTTIINLTDNSIVYKNGTLHTQKITGKWNNPPEYTNLKNGILKAIDETLSDEKIKLL
jgi:hypothetical protein